jgi:protocatechuate 3,4-dioxygenase beta subunit/predicted Ser/Thr protein kinase
MKNIKNCPNCGKPLPENALEGMCPVCLMGGGLPTDDHYDTDSEAGAFVPPALEDLAVLFPQLELLELIGRGGMGAVYKARQPELDRLVALKILTPRSPRDPGFTERFTREARALARLSHPHIVAVYDFGHKEDLSYFIMEYVDGPNLRQVQRTGDLSSAEALAIVPQICEALQFAHNEGVVHRDIKPENVLLDQKGRVRIADFGLAKIVGRDPQHLTLTQEGHVMGTPHYMAPEQVEHPHEVDHRADIYSLGVVFYEMLTGELPLGKFAAPSKKVQVDVRLDDVVLRSLEKEPELRYQQVGEVGTEVETIVSTAVETEDGDLRTEGRGQKTDDGVAHARKYLLSPGMGLIISGCLSSAYWLMLVATSVWYMVQPLKASQGRPPVYINSHFVIMAVVCLTWTVLAWLSFRRRKGSYPLAIAVSISVILVIPFSLLGIPFGIWSLVLLRKKEVRESFQEAAISKPKLNHRSKPLKPHFSRTAIVGALWSVFFVEVAFPGLLIRLIVLTETTPWDLSLWGKPLMNSVRFLGVAAPLGTTILGWEGVTQIRRSAGRLYGLWLAVCDGLLFPLFLLDAGTVWLWSLLNNEQSPLWYLGWPENVFFMALTILLTNGLIVHSVWRRVRPSEGSTLSVGRLWMRRLAVGLLLVVIGGGLLSAFCQRPIPRRDGIGEDSPDGLYSLSAQTRCAMRICGGDELCYFIQLQGRGGTYFRRWKIPVPTEGLANDWMAPHFRNRSLVDHGRIEWSDDSRTVRLLVSDVEVFRSTESRLAFRMVPKNTQYQGPLSNQDEARLRAEFQEQGPFPGETDADYIWIPFQGKTVPPEAVAEAYLGQVYVLASNRQADIMLPDGSWGLDDTGTTTNQVGEPIVSVQFDHSGSDAFHALTSANRGKLLGIVIDGVMVSAPTVKTAISGRAIIDGNFSQNRVNELADALIRGMSRVMYEIPIPALEAATLARQAPVVDFNDARFWREQIVRHLDAVQTLEGEFTCDHQVSGDNARTSEHHTRHRLWLKWDRTQQWIDCRSEGIDDPESKAHVIQGEQYAWQFGHSGEWSKLKPGDPSLNQFSFFGEVRKHAYEHAFDVAQGVLCSRYLRWMQQRGQLDWTDADLRYTRDALGGHELRITLAPSELTNGSDGIPFNADLILSGRWERGAFKLRRVSLYSETHNLEMAYEAFSFHLLKAGVWVPHHAIHHSHYGLKPDGRGGLATPYPYIETTVLAQTLSVNQPMRAETFDGFSPPVGTQVHDRITGETYWVQPDLDRIAAAGGKTRAAVRGRVYLDGRPAVGMTVWTTPPEDVNKSRRRFIKTQTDDRGAFELSGLVPGFEYRIRADESETLVRLSELGRDTTNLKIDLTSGLSVSGVIRDVQGKPIPDALVLFYPHKQTVKTDAQGRYQVNGLYADEQYEVEVAAWGRAPLDPGGETVVKHYAIELDPNGDPLDHDVTLQPERILHGRIIDQDGKPLNNVMINARGASVCVTDRKDWHLSHSNEEGYFRIGNLGNRKYSLTVGQYGEASYSPAESPILIRIAGDSLDVASR